MPKNRAAWICHEKQYPLEIKEAPYPTPAADEVVIKNAAVAINPVDWKMQREAIFSFVYATILGHDVAGEVVEVGSAVTNVKKGDRVAAHAHAMDSQGAKWQYGAFMEYTLHTYKLVSAIPDSLSIEQAAVLPLAISTAASGLYSPDFLNLQRPALDPKPAGQSLLVWGGASSIGCLTVQLAKASGYEVVTTASPRNFELVRSLGADHIVDYNSKTVIDDIVDVLKGKTVAGAYDAIAGGATAMCAEVLGHSNGSKFIACVLPPPEKLPGGCTSKMFYALDILHNGVAEDVWVKYVPEALRQGKLQAKPEALVAGHGLEEVQKAVDRQAEGVSARKVVCMI